MQDEDGYITLNPKPRKPEPIPAAPVSFSWWRVMALILLVLSVGLFVGLVALGIMSVTQQNYLQTENERLAQSLQRASQETSAKLQIKQMEEKHKGNYAHPCSPCESGWIYGDHCYGFFRHNLTWEEGKLYCADVNATMTRVNSQSVLVEKYRDKAQLLDHSGDPRPNMSCAYFHNGKIRPTFCTDRHYFMCERKAGLAKVEHLPG
ncbi:LOW QUALITY PROTEIN: C-type lectin domain family 1 member B [Thomomys bottae]